MNLAGLLDRIRTRLDLAWITRGADAQGQAELAQDAPAAASLELPEAERETLRVLGDLGHVRGILGKLDQIDRLDSRYGAFTARLRAHVQAFRLPEYMALLQAGEETHDAPQS